jgi:hypothetical protein
MTTRWTRTLLPAALLLTAGCAGQTPFHGGLKLAPSLLPEYQSALATQPPDVTTFFRSWLPELTPLEDDSGRIAYAVEGTQAEVLRSVDRLLAGYEGYCTQRGGTLAKPSDAPGRRCLAAKGETIARVEVDVVHAAEAEPARLRFAAETGERVRRNEVQRLAQQARVQQTLSGNGPAGHILLASGEAFDALRFGRLSAPDYYAIQLPQRDPIGLTELLSVRWTSEGIRVVLRDGSVITESGKAVVPARSLVRLVPSESDAPDMDAMSYEAPFRFVTLDPKSKQPRQVRVRDIAQLLEISVSPKAPALRAGPVPVRADPKEQAAFSQALVKEATRASKNLKAGPEPINLADASARDEIERMGRMGPCSRSQSDVALRSGDLSLSEFYVCAQYRKEAKLLLASNGAVSPEKTPLVYLGRAARAPWFDFGGVLR